MSEPAKRQPYLIGFIGTNRTGKTTEALKIAKKYRETHGKKNEIIAFDPQGKFKDVADYFITSKDDIVNLLDRKDFLLILDDYQALYPAFSMDQTLVYLLTKRAEHGMDMIFITHAPALIKQGMTYYMTHLFIFYTNMGKEVIGIDKKVPNSEFIEFLFRLINEEIKSTGGLDLAQKDYPNFRHIIYHYSSEKYVTKNFKNEKSKKAVQTKRTKKIN